MSRTVLLTGATGFIGGSLLLELLRTSDDTIFCLVRGDRRNGPVARLDAALSHACEAYGMPELLPIARERCVAVEGDITRPVCGVDLSAVGPVDVVWHSAASLAFEDDREEAIYLANVQGTQNVIGLIDAVGAGTYNHFSTAYVGGARNGTIDETIPPPNTPCNNAYERSKLAAEHLVAALDLPRVRIFRPSIVIGHSETLVATSYTGLYGFVRSLRRLRTRIDPVVGGLLEHRSLRLIAEPDAPINLIPVDHVTGPAVAISQSASTEVVFHLTNSAAPPLAQSMEVVAEKVGIRAPRYVDSRDELNSIDERVDDELTFYGSYLRDIKLFDRSNSDAVLGAGSGAFPIDPEALGAYVGWYVDMLDDRVGRRARAQAGVAT